MTILKGTGNPQGKGIDNRPKGRRRKRVLCLPDEVAYCLVVRPFKVEIKVPKQYEVCTLGSPL